MNATTRKKRHERFLLERFIEASELEIEIVDDSQESPDFFCRFEGRAIGIELTQLFTSHAVDGSARQVEESITSRIISRARQLYLESKAAPTHVTVCFHSNHDLRKVDMHETAGRLATFVRGLRLAEWQRSDWTPRISNDPLFKHIAFLHTLGVPRYDMGHWTVARAGWVATLTAEMLQSRISEKSARLMKYRDTVEENWLVVMSDATKPSQMFQVPSDFDASEVSSPFSRTFFYAHPGRAVVELGINR